MKEVKKEILDRKIGYWQYELAKLEDRILKEASERVDIKERLVHLHSLQVHEDFNMKKQNTDIIIQNSFIGMDMLSPLEISWKKMQVRAAR